ncbi:hypothetical protein B0H17DRAFT_1217914 [Mycena rosella]|uniref:Uncharacterized protein n=1 Tax=Mycena rosella TaxID=1033263 RepID=A0AAD7BVF7_MYCRO|nr:hypothetical protein B0H17DRAFT_1217914 [Mycena rosella]
MHSSPLDSPHSSPLLTLPSELLRVHLHRPSASPPRSSRSCARAARLRGSVWGNPALGAGLGGRSSRARHWLLVTPAVHLMSVVRSARIIVLGLVRPTKITALYPLLTHDADARATSSRASSPAPPPPSPGSTTPTSSEFKAVASGPRAYGLLPKEHWWCPLSFLVRQDDPTLWGTSRVRPTILRSPSSQRALTPAHTY